MHKRFHERRQLQRLSEIVHEEHMLRLDVKIEEQLVPRKFKHRPRPQTAIIARAAHRVVEAREGVERQLSQKARTGTHGC